MDNYIKTIINGLKAWVENCIMLLEEKGNKLNFKVEALSDSKAEQRDPVFTGAFSQNRADDTPIGEYSHAEGHGCAAIGSVSHAEGDRTLATGDYSHAEGWGANASGSYSHAEGCNTAAIGDHSHVQGRNNIVDYDRKYAHIVGNGTNSPYRRSNAHTLDWHGVPWYQGRPQFGGTAQDDGSQAVMANGDTEITLKSPAGKLYKITVSDDGTLTTTEVTT